MVVQVVKARMRTGIKVCLKHFAVKAALALLWIVGYYVALYFACGVQLTKSDIGSNALPS